MTIQFSDLLHDKNLLAALRSAGYIEPTPIQTQALPARQLKGRLKGVLT